ncbi:hypothetical protein Tco_1395072 [Tanacetum coccineum]
MDDSLRVMGLIHEICTAKKRGKDVEWFKEKMLLAQAQEAGVILQEEQQDLLADGWKNLIQTVMIFSYTHHHLKAEHVDAFNSDCDEAPTTSAIFMARLYPVVSNNDSYDELTSNSNVISYADYMITTENDVAQSVHPPEQDKDMILSVIEQKQSQVE